MPLLLMSIQGYSGLFSISIASLIDTEYLLLQQMEVFLKWTLTSIDVISSFMIGKKSSGDFSYQYFWGRMEAGYRAGFPREH